MAANAKDTQLREYKDMVKQLNTTIQVQANTIASMQNTLDQNTETINNLKEQIAYLTKKLFGTSSEKMEVAGQLNLFDEAEQEASLYTQEDLQSDDDSSKDESKRNKKRSNKELFKGIPVVEEVVDLSEEERKCPDCGDEMTCIGKEFVREEFHFTPAKGSIHRIYRKTYKCETCSNASTLAENIKFVKAHVPEALIFGSPASPSSVAWLMYQKYANGLPLYRQEKDWMQQGINITRATMGHWIITCAMEYFKPVYDHLHKELLKRTFLMADETRIQVLKEPERDPETDSFMWLFRTGEDHLPTIILFHYTETRAKYNAEDFLKGFSGYLETDGYQGYNNLPGVKRCSCWAHTRRYFMDAVPKGKEFDYSNPAVQGVQFCSRLFEYERISKEKKHAFEQRKQYRLEKEKPVLNAFFNWLEVQHPTKGSRMDKAVNYALKRKEQLTTYLEDGRCSLSNNLSENSIRPFTVGRKNWLFSDTPKGAEASALAYTMVEMARAHELNIYKYLTYLLEKRPSKDWTDAEFEAVVPWNEAVLDNCRS